MAAENGKKGRSKDDIIDWFTVSYRSLYMVAGAVVLLGAAGAWWFFDSREQAPPLAEETPAPTQTSARFVSLEGSVQVKFSGTLQWMSADRGMVLNKADLVRTGSSSSAEVRFFDGTMFQIRSDSLVTIEETSEDPRSRQRRVSARIQSGEVNFQAPRRSVPGTTTISTPTVRTEASGESAGNILVQESGDSGIRVFKGNVRAESKSGQAVTLDANTAVRVDAEGKVGPKVVLPEVPVLLAPPHQADISYADPSRATTLLAWRSVPGAVAYHIRLDFSSSFTRPMVDRTDWKPTSMEVRSLEAGTYYWQVAALDKDGQKGSFAEFSRFTITGGLAPSGSPPPLAIEPLAPRGNIVQVRGSTERGATVTINGQRVDVRDDGSFDEFVTLPAGNQTVLVRAVGLSGGAAETRRSVRIAD
jgi:hypothetical protein